MFPFTIRQLELFSSLCSTGSFQATADEFRISQPSVSNQISMLEFQLGIKLFTRERGRRPMLTSEGLQFRTEMQAFLDLGHQLARRRSPKVRAAPTRIRLFIGTVLFNECVKHELADFYAANPDLDLELLHDRPRAQLLRDVRQDRFDFAAFYHWDQIEMPEMEQLETVPAGIFAHPDLAKIATTTDQISALPFLLPPKNSFEETSVLAWLNREGIVPRNVLARVADYEIGRNLMRKEKCICYSNEFAMMANGRPDAVLVYPMGHWHCHFYVSRRADPAISERIRAFMRHCLGRFRERPGSLPQDRARQQ